MLWRARPSPELLFGLLSDLPGYGRWLPPSGQFTGTTDVEPYPVRLGTRYRDGRPAEPGKDWQGSVTGFRPPGSIDFHHIIRVRQLRVTVDVRIHYALEEDGQGTTVTRWLVLDMTTPTLIRPLRPAITSRFDKENAHAGDSPAPADPRPDSPKPYPAIVTTTRF